LQLAYVPVHVNPQPSLHVAVPFGTPAHACDVPPVVQPPQFCGSCA
jgi:hypothetical protein